MKKNSFAWNLQRDEFFQFWNFREFIFQILCNVWITTDEKRDKASIAINFSNFIWFSLFGCTFLDALISPSLISYIFREKFPNQCKKQTNSRMPSNILLLYKASSWIWWVKKLGSHNYMMVYKYVCFIRFQNLVYKKTFIIRYSKIIGQ